ncbi:MAG TPA: hypothetical protein VFS12_11785 [Terriglobia bacterium]|nr:hypothetical protein [Terriglobia bacterium]
MLDDSHAFADVDLDVHFHRSSAHDVFKDFNKRYPDTNTIYQF